MAIDIIDCILTIGQYHPEKLKEIQDMYRANGAGWNFSSTDKLHDYIMNNFPGFYKESSDSMNKLFKNKD